MLDEPSQINSIFNNWTHGYIFRSDIVEYYYKIPKQALCKNALRLKRTHKFQPKNSPWPHYCDSTQSVHQ